MLKTGDFQKKTLIFVVIINKKKYDERIEMSPLWQCLFG